jgi:hypothetical protein
MRDSNDSDSSVSWIADRPGDGGDGEVSRVEVIPDPDSETVTFASRRPEDGETTTAWITANAALVVDAAEMQ